MSGSKKKTSLRGLTWARAAVGQRLPLLLREPAQLERLADAAAGPAVAPHGQHAAAPPLVQPPPASALKTGTGSRPATRRRPPFRAAEDDTAAAAAAAAAPSPAEAAPAMPPSDRLGKAASPAAEGRAGLRSAALLMQALLPLHLSGVHPMMLRKRALASTIAPVCTSNSSRQKGDCSSVASEDDAATDDREDTEDGRRAGLQLQMLLLGARQQGHLLLQLADAVYAGRQHARLVPLGRAAARLRCSAVSAQAHLLLVASA